MNQFTKHFWFTFSALSVEFPLHSNEVYSAPVRAFAELQKTILPALETDLGPQQTAVDFFPNHPVIPNRPALAEIVVVGSVSIILALLSGIVLWVFIIKKTMESLVITSFFRLFSKLVPSGNPTRGKKWHNQKEDSAWRRRTEKLKRFDFSALRPKRKKQTKLKEDIGEKEVKEMWREKEKPAEERSKRQEKKGEEKEKKAKVAKRQRKQMILGKIKKTKSKLQQKYIKGKKSLSLARKKLRKER